MGNVCQVLVQGQLHTLVTVLRPISVPRRKVTDEQVLMVDPVRLRRKVLDLEGQCLSWVWGGMGVAYVR